MSVEHRRRLFPRSKNVSLSDFHTEIFGALSRADQRRWSHAYLNGLLTVSDKKTLQRLAAAAQAPPHGLHQFINSSPWDWKPPRRALARLVADAMPVRAWTVGMSIIPKRGEHSVGVHRRFVGDVGRTVNCQAALGLFLSSTEQAIPVEWRILLGDSWLRDEHRRRRVRIPEMVRAMPDWSHLVDFADVIAEARTVARVPLVAELVGVRDVGPLVGELAQRDIDFVLEVAPGQPVSVIDDRSPFRRWSPADVTTAREFVVAAKARQPHIVPTVDDRGRKDQSIIYSGTVALPRGRMSAMWPHRGYRLLAEWSTTTRSATRCWITSLDAWRVEDVLALARQTHRVRSMVKDLENGFGLLDFEGRSYPGWHHHMTMVSAAHAYRRLFHRSADDDRAALADAGELTRAQ